MRLSSIVFLLGAVSCTLGAVLPTTGSPTTAKAPASAAKVATNTKTAEKAEPFDGKSSYQPLTFSV